MSRSNADRPPRRGRGPLLVALAVCVAGAAALVLLPIGWPLNRFVVWLFYAGRDAGSPDWVALEHYEIALNVLLFAVPVAFAAALWPRVKWWQWITAVAVVSATIEVVQLLALPRVASVGDVLANTAGAAVGVGVVIAARRLCVAAARSASARADSPD